MSNIHKTSALVLVLTAICFVLCCPVPASTRTPVLVELFTSEGCSSCPPAEALLRMLDSAQPIPKAQLIVLEEHVDYWDDQGWHDPFSSHAFTLRQTDYDDRLRVKNGPYTPEMIVDGTAEFVGSDRAKAAAALQRAVAEPKIGMEISALHVENRKVSAHVTTGPVTAKAEVYVALALDHAQSEVLRGENGGKRLEHVAVVRRLSGLGRVKKVEPFSKDFVLDLDGKAQAYRVIAFIQSGDGKVLGATSARFEETPAQDRAAPPQ